MQEHLLNALVPYWENLFDERGGYYGIVDKNEHLCKDAHKGVILNSRILYFFTNVYALTKDEVAKKHAYHAYRFLIDCCVDKEFGGVYWMMNCDSTVKDDVKHSYNQAFAVYALSSYAITFHSLEALEYALSIFNLLEEHAAEENGYIEEFTREWVATKNEKLADENPLAKRTMNTLLHLVEAYTELYIASNSQAVKNRLGHLLYIFETVVYNPTLKRFELFFNEDMHSTMNALSFGHDIEASWLLDRAYDTLGQKIPPYTLAVLINSINLGKSPTGYIYNQMTDKAIDKTAVWWVQSESIVGLINGYQKSSDNTMLTQAEEIWSYIKATMLLHSGAWLPYLNEDATSKDRNIVDEWTCPYHNGRMCFEIIKKM